MSDMITYIGVKVVVGRPMTRGQYNRYRGWENPEEADSNEPGYLVEYRDGVKPNDNRHTGYIVWTPATVFEAGFKPTDQMTFVEALKVLQEDIEVYRKSWGDGHPKITFVRKQGHMKSYLMMTEYSNSAAVSTETLPWIPSQDDLFADDWCEV